MIELQQTFSLDDHAQHIAWNRLTGQYMLGAEAAFMERGKQHKRILGNSAGQHMSSPSWPQRWEETGRPPERRPYFP
jgi:hypothetical protein